MSNNYTPGWKYNHWELKGVPIRIEIGPKDIKNKQITVVRRDSGAKSPVPFANMAKDIKSLLDDFQRSLFEKAKKTLDKHTVTVDNWKEFNDALDERNIVLAPWCGDEKCEESIKARSGEAADKKEKAAKKSKTESSEQSGAVKEKLTGAAKSLCIPFKQPSLNDFATCVGCHNSAKTYCLFGRSY